MEVQRLAIPEVCLLTPRVFGDQRGFFLESWNRKTFADLGLDLDFVQDNHSRSARGVLRGLHYQIEQAQGKLVRVVEGEVFDVAVDLRKRSVTFGQWVGARLSATNQQMLWIPPGFAHGFYVLSEFAQFLYKATDYYLPSAERCLLWNDPTLNISWPIPAGETPLLAAKDAAGLPLAQCEVFA
ncbi:dTDP-4-dehydrorhamnose 3,5-epimerase [Acidithiobacillus sp. CV18-2]|uniref:dTDP-4-dehydrorhamnose 3,5-epimerase n=1 Tax=Igneacidithiobacillus copahuensis TaxID=2724909 RepID=A0AAE2YQ26_9PROT|nr:dTDP-4-dehydrorhamnose 3,5-epimerase [Igneacidithiobacillus copahuensis]MBU2755457.1 dTDP-4-dehydrorhamnose 3,5-epimerase [Acidithiobacillus sp. CV18-3]MBU2757897.1 dTDP-4-dehydrorhamnose 3,5-epimerase [Acidithiobacillus sp. BN09-2]MBU2778183.1 dTDP-4-dehydrorhamnose 3,5-epimerase [Acidithiobacillus sp. CV18-2]MBU2797006.1 dTDP-4-dehydrorhamnose 3,5-epimerase [Acidithiobacillus sp. VAN18-2]MBU2800536.1 dTDP-4-dehydrorhamnose 3,5-epimerase [Acidithiobacillus sp. VAN18-4]UTV80487.1 dTDP-4-de